MIAGEDSHEALPLHLLRLISPSQPVGSFSYSRGLESAVHAEIVHDEQTASNWILGVLEHSYASLDGALFWRMIHALREQDDTRFSRANAWLLAARESKELELEDRRMSESLLRLLIDLQVSRAQAYADRRLSYPASFAIACDHWHVSPISALYGLMWSVVEGQVAAATRLVPLGHTSSQRILIASMPFIERAADSAMNIADEDIGNVAPALAMMSAWHETQYSRLFRS